MPGARARRAACVAAIALVATSRPLAAQAGDDSWKNLVADAQHASADHDYAKAEQILLKALHEAERFAADDWRVGVTLESLGQVWRAGKKLNDAEKALERSRDITAKANGENSVEVANVNFELAGVLLDSGRPADAAAAARRALSAYESLRGGADTQTGDALCVLGDSLRAMKNLPEAETALKRCLNIRQGDGGLDTPRFADALYSLALTYAGEAKYGLAEPRFVLAEKIREKALGLTSPLLAQTFEDHASVLKSMGREKEASRLLLLASAIRRNEKRSRR
ncbi:MAG TPA: tetratricopeptide repeat protein [Bryobacteraceae bacterium]|jgi:tetratricopeptide (TPR) repeat protein|nr:tetratricopeptide repeat protein [Bryobacteraceae bacterium]